MLVCLIPLGAPAAENPYDAIAAKMIAEEAVHKTTSHFYRQQYLACAKRATPLVDDGVSDPNIVAAGLHVLCKKSFGYEVLPDTEIEDLGEAMRPILHNQILAHRHKPQNRWM